MDLISCITPTFNRRHLLERAIQSCLNQTYSTWEMIIVDDGSEDDTESIVRAYIIKDRRIKYFRSPGKGASFARNFGILQCTGEYVVFLDDDDEHLPHRFESQLAAIKGSGYDFILSWFQVKDLETGQILFPKMHINTGEGAGHGVRWMIKRDLLIKAGLFDVSMPAMQEVELSYRIAKYSSYAIHDAIVMSGGINHNSITKTSEKMIQGRTKLLEKHGSTMHPKEAGWWYFILGLDYYSVNKSRCARQNIRLAAQKSGRVIYWLGFLIILSCPYKGIIKQGIHKLLQGIADFRFPKLVIHPVIKEGINYN